MRAAADAISTSPADKVSKMTIAIALAIVRTGDRAKGTVRTCGDVNTC
jgi:hypothetical protein